MPMLDLYIPDGALQPDIEAALLNQVTEILIRYEGFDPTDPVVRAASWAFLHRPADVYVGGAPADAPRYKVIASVPEGQLDEHRRAGVIAEVTDAILDAEDGTWPRDAGRIWVFPTEVPDGHWGGHGQATPLSAILSRLGGLDPGQARVIAAQRIAASRGARHGAG